MTAPETNCDPAKVCKLCETPARDRPQSMHWTPPRDGKGTPPDWLIAQPKEAA